MLEVRVARRCPALAGVACCGLVCVARWRVLLWLLLAAAVVWLWLLSLVVVCVCWHCF